MKNIVPVEAIAAIALPRIAPATRAAQAAVAPAAVDAFEARSVSPGRALNLQVATQNALLKALMASSLSRAQHLTSMSIIRNIGASERRG